MVPTKRRRPRQCPVFPTTACAVLAALYLILPIVPVISIGIVAGEGAATNVEPPDLATGSRATKDVDGPLVVYPDMAAALRANRDDDGPLVVFRSTAGDAVDTDATAYADGAAVAVTFRYAGTARGGDWLGIYPADAAPEALPRGGAAAWVYSCGSRSCVSGASEGTAVVGGLGAGRYAAHFIPVCGWRIQRFRQVYRAAASSGVFSVAPPGATDKPTYSPTNEATDEPTYSPTDEPTYSPTDEPTTATPTASPTTAAPTASPTVSSTAAPTYPPTSSPTVPLTSSPTVPPTALPTAEPTASPTSEPTYAPTGYPTERRTTEPTSYSTALPTFTPTRLPTMPPTKTVTAPPTAAPQPADTTVTRRHVIRSVTVQLEGDVPWPLDADAIARWEVLTGQRILAAIQDAKIFAAVRRPEVDVAIHRNEGTDNEPPPGRIRFDVDVRYRVNRDVPHGNLPADKDVRAAVVAALGGGDAGNEGYLQALRREPPFAGADGAALLVPWSVAAESTTPDAGGKSAAAVGVGCAAAVVLALGCGAFCRRRKTVPVGDSVFGDDDDKDIECDGVSMISSVSGRGFDFTSIHTLENLYTLEYSQRSAAVPVGGEEKTLEYSLRSVDSLWSAVVPVGGEKET